MSLDAKEKVLIRINVETEGLFKNKDAWDFLGDVRASHVVHEKLDDRHPKRKRILPQFGLAANSAGSFLYMERLLADKGRGFELGRLAETAKTQLCKGEILWPVGVEVET